MQLVHCVALCNVLHCMWDTWWQFGLVAKADLHPLTASWHCGWYCALFCTVLQTALRLHFCTVLQMALQTSNCFALTFLHIHQSQGWHPTCTIHYAQCNLQWQRHCTVHCSHCTVFNAPTYLQCRIHYAKCTMYSMRSAICSDKGSQRVGIGGFTRLLPCNYTHLLSIHTALRTLHHFR